MNLPYLKTSKRKSAQTVVSFRGVNYGEGGGDGQLEDSRNVTSERYPVLSPRAGRSIEGEYEDATAVYYKNGQFVVNGTDLLYNGEVIANVTAGKKQFVSVNSKVVVYPDKVMFDTATGEVRKLGAEYLSENDVVEFIDSKTIALHQGKYYTKVVATGNIGGTGTTSDDKPTLRHWDRILKYQGATVNPETGEFSLGDAMIAPLATVYNESSNLNISIRYLKEGVVFTKAYKSDRGGSIGQTLFELDPLKQWAVVTKVYFYQRAGIAGPTADGGYVNNPTGDPYFGFDYEIREVAGLAYEPFNGFEALGFRVGDTVEIEGLETMAEENGNYTIRGFGTHKTAEGTELHTVIFDDEAFAKTGTDSGKVSIRRKTPDLSIVCESNNRLWGAEGNTIYASALGDPTNVFTYDGLDTDSYAVAVASDGAFTGCIGYGNSVLFFKEDRMYKILGDYPSNYTMYEYQVPGVKLGSESSLHNINETLYYHGREGVYRYGGGSPELISENFGVRRFRDAAAGAEGDRYYISMQDVASQGWGLWVYDTLRGVWLQEDESQGVDFAYNDGKLRFIDGDGHLVCVNPDESDEKVAWSATLCRMDETYLNRKCYSKLVLRADLLEDRAWLRVEISCDDGPWKLVYTGHDEHAKTLNIPILPKRCDNFRIRLSGEGKCMIRTLQREFSVNSTI